MGGQLAAKCSEAWAAGAGLIVAVALVLAWPYLWLIAIAGAGLALLYFLLRNPFWAYVAFVFSLPFATLRLIPIRGISNPAFMAIIVLSLSVIFNLHRLPPLRMGRLGVKPWLLALFIAVALITSPFTINQPDAVRFAVIAIAILLLYLLGTMLIADRAKLRICANWFLLGTALSACIILYDFFFVHGPLKAGFYRAGSFYAGGPATGIVICFLVATPVALLFAEEKRYWIIRLGYFAVAALSAATIIFSATRSAWLALAFLALIELFRRPVRAVVGVGLMLLLVVGVVRLYLPVMYERYTIRAFSALNPQYGKQTEVGFRIENYQVGAKMLASYPLFGVGLANFGTHAGQFGRETVPVDLGLNAHNAVLEVLACAGLIGGLAYVLVWLLTFYELIFAARRGPPPVRPLALGMAVGFVLYVTHSMFHSGYAALLLAFIFAMSTVMSRLSREGKAPSETARA